MGWRGFLVGALALIALETIVQPTAAGRVGGLFTTVANGAKKFLDPAVPAITVAPKAKTSSSSGSGGFDIGGFLGDLFSGGPIAAAGNLAGSVLPLATQGGASTPTPSSSTPGVLV